MNVFIVSDKMFHISGGKHSYFAAFAADVAAFLYGTSIAWSSPITAILEDVDLERIPLGRQITIEEKSWIGSLSALGGIISPPILGYFSHKIGRKWTITAVVVLHVAAYVISAFAKTVWLFYVARILMGMGIGGIFLSSVYCVEIAENVNRGFLSSSVNTAIVLGLLFSYSLGPFVSIMAFNLTLSTVGILYGAFFWCIAPESPYYLASVNDDEKALIALHSLRRKTNKEHQTELDDIKMHLKELEPGSFFDVFKSKANFKAFLYGVLLTTFHQFCGINVILSYTQNIFDDAGSALPSEVSSIIVAMVQVLVALITPLIVDRYGRRFFLIISTIGMIFAEVALGCYFYMADSVNMSALNWLPIVFLVVFVMFYNFGLAAMAWVIMAEILPSNIRSKAAAFTTSFYWLNGFILTKSFSNLSNIIGMAGSFWLFALFDVCCLIFVYFFMFETNGKSFKDIQEILNN